MSPELITALAALIAAVLTLFVTRAERKRAMDQVEMLKELKPLKGR
ncbi:hypothetical protein [Kocuria rosea]|nr:hypothetical protein [Kocuria rosea]WIG19216.1 hypothetical protein QOY29_17190 [Kocuria rosea]